VSKLVDDPTNNPEKEIIDINEDSYSNSNRNTCWQRFFSKITNGSFRGALISVCIFSLGPGIQSMPLKFSKVGLFIGWGILLIASLINYMTMNILLKLSTNYKIKSYPSLVKRIFGSFFSNVLNLFVIFNNMGAFTLYLVIGNIFYINIII